MELLANGSMPFVSIENNSTSLKNFFSYCFACKTGIKLGREIGDQGALGFIGYNNDVKIQYMYFGALDSFVDVAVKGIESFINHKTIKQTIIDMKNSYTHYMDEYYKKNMIIASMFMDNRDCLVAHGNLNLSISDFIILY